MIIFVDFILRFCAVFLKRSEIRISHLVETPSHGVELCTDTLCVACQPKRTNSLHFEFCWKNLGKSNELKIINWVGYYDMFTQVIKPTQ